MSQEICEELYGEKKIFSKHLYLQVTILDSDNLYLYGIKYSYVAVNLRRIIWQKNNNPL